MAERLAGLGYVVLAPDLFYRLGAYGPFDAREVFASGELMKTIAPLFTSTDTKRAARDTAAFLDYLDSRDDIAGAKIGTTGYCMGGALSLAVAGAHPDRVAAAASFHAGNLITPPTPRSPHLLMADITGKVYIAGADHDRGGYPPEMAAEVERILSEAGVEHRCEIYPRRTARLRDDRLPPSTTKRPPNGIGANSKPCSRASSPSSRSRAEYAGGPPRFSARRARRGRALRR